MIEIDSGKDYRYLTYHQIDRWLTKKKKTEERPEARWLTGKGLKNRQGLRAVIHRPLRVFLPWYSFPRSHPCWSDQSIALSLPSSSMLKLTNVLFPFGSFRAIPCSRILPALFPCESFRINPLGSFRLIPFSSFRMGHPANSRIILGWASSLACTDCPCIPGADSSLPSAIPLQLPVYATASLRLGIL